MKRLILHVGPAKCGSTSIQHFFTSNNNPCVQNIHFELLNSNYIAELNHIEPNESITTIVNKLLLERISECDIVILSHEFLFQCPNAIKNICSLAEDLFSEISIIGYSRRQSDFLISAYSQWSFRSPDRIREAVDTLNQLQLDPDLFSGIERQLIEHVVNDFRSVNHLFWSSIHDWHNSYKRISQIVQASGAVIKCGLLPNKYFDNTSLIQDFCEKSDLILRDEIIESSQLVSNSSFNQYIIEAINNAVNFGFEMPDPHDDNADLHLLSTKITPMMRDSSNLLPNLTSYIDTYYFNSNMHFCREYGLPETYFSPSSRFSKPAILEIIKYEGQQRALNKSAVIRDARILTAQLIELCLKLTKDSRAQQA